MKHFILGCILGGILATVGGVWAQYQQHPSNDYQNYLQQNQQHQELLNELRMNNMIQRQRNNQQLLNPC